MNKSFIISGSGGQGVISVGKLLANIFMKTEALLQDIQPLLLK